MNSNKIIPIIGLLIILILSIGFASASDADSDLIIGYNNDNIDLITSETVVDEIDYEENADESIANLNDDEIISDDVGSINDVDREVGVKNSLGASQDSEILTSTIQFTQNKYSTYFDASGNIISGKLNKGDILDFSGTFNSKTFIINIPLTLTSSDGSAKFIDSNFQFVEGADGTNVYYLDVRTGIANKPIFEAINVNNLTFSNNNLFSSATSSYPIILRNVNDSNIFFNHVESTIYDGHTPSAIVLSNASHNNISSNDVVTNDSNGINLDAYLNSRSINAYNYIINNTVHNMRGVEWALDSNGKVPMPSSFGMGIQVNGPFNEIINNTLYNLYTGISAPQNDNKIIGNIIYNIHGVSLLGNTAEEGGDYAIYASTNSLIENNTIWGCIFRGSVTAAISANANSNIRNNIIKNNEGIAILVSGSNVNITNNKIEGSTSYGVYAYSNNNVTNVIIADNVITSMCEYSIYLQKHSTKIFPQDFLIENNTIYTLNQNPIYFDDYCTNIVVNNNDIIYNIHYINESNFFDFFTNELYLNNNVKENDTLIFIGDFNSKGKIYINDKVNIKGIAAKFIDTTFIILNDDVTIEDIEISNPNNNNILKFWGIQLNEVQNVTIKNCKISIYDPDCAYAIYLFNSSNCNIINNTLEAKGNYLTSAILSFCSRNILIDGNALKSIGTGEKYLCNDNSCLDGYLSTYADGCVDGCIDGCLDGEGSPIYIDGVYPGTHIVKNIFKTYGFLMVHPTNISFTNNKVDVTSSLDSDYNLNESCNAIGGVFIQYGGVNNTISNNTINLNSNDPISYGVGIIGATNSSAEGSINNTFSGNNISIISNYYAIAINLGEKAIESTFINNVFDLYAVKTISILNNTGVDDDKNVFSENSFNLIERHFTKLIVTDSSYKFNNQNKIVQITLKDVNGTVLANKNIVIVLNGKTYNIKTNSNGIATVQASLANIGTYPITATFVSESEYFGTTASGKIVVNKDSTSMSSSGKTYTVTTTSKTITVTLKDGSGNLVANRKVTVTVNGKTVSATTNSKGVATFNLALNAVKTYTVSLKFAGDSYYTASSSSVKVKVTKTKTKLTVPKKTYKAKAKTKKLTATLKDQTGKVIKSKKITFIVNKKKYTARTNKKGVVTVKVKLSKKKTYKFTVKFAGDKTYVAVKKTGKVKIK